MNTLFNSNLREEAGGKEVFFIMSTMVVKFAVQIVCNLEHGSYFI